MAEPVSERAHYVVDGDAGGRADLFLFQDGRLESSGLLPVIWRQGRRGGPGAATRGDGPPSRPWWGFFRAVASILIFLL
jgi:hypothetical protein